MSERTIIVLKNQTLFDVAIQEFGSDEASFQLAVDNGIGVTDDLIPGSEITIKGSTEDKYKRLEVLAYYKKHSVKPATKPLASSLPILLDEEGEPILTEGNQFINL